MKKTLFICLSCWLLSFSNAESKNLQARFAYSSFLSPEKGPYIETYIDVSGRSVFYTKTNSGKFQAAIEVSLVFLINDSIKYFDKYNLLSPETTDTSLTIFNFTDQQRISLPNGNYMLELSIKDKNNIDAKPYTIKQEIQLSLYPNVIAISDVELLASYNPTTIENKVNKNGYEILPLVNNFYDKNLNSFKFYAEIYGTSAILSKEDFLLSYHIETFEKKQILENFTRISRQTSKPVNILLGEFDITNLSSGNYNFVIEIRNRKNELLAIKECFFQRSNPLPTFPESGELSYKNLNIENTFVANFTNRDTLMEFTRSLFPLSTINENSFIENQLDNSNIKIIQQFFYDFWVKRNSMNPELAWTNYKLEVDKVNQEYSVGRKKGYLTDRGRIYLAYGAPNQLSKMYNEPASYPYEIWQYYKVKEQNDRKFVFYCPQLATNDFELLHSDLRGEVINPNWQVILRKRTEIMNDLDKMNPSNNYQNQSKQLFDNPR